MDFINRVNGMIVGLIWSMLYFIWQLQALFFIFFSPFIFIYDITRWVARAFARLDLYILSYFVFSSDIYQLIFLKNHFCFNSKISHFKIYIVYKRIVGQMHFMIYIIDSVLHMHAPLLVPSHFCPSKDYYFRNRI